MSKHKPVRPAVVVVGNAQAAAIARVLQHLPHVAERYVVERSDAVQTCAKHYGEGSILLEQIGGEGAPSKLPPGVTKGFRFPNLTLDLLWPLATANPINKPDPPEFPLGPFPYGDAFLQACLAVGTPRPQVLRLYFQSTWSASWPDIDELLRSETERLNMLDSACDVHIGSYILTHFRERRLFLTPDAPTDILLGEVVSQLLALAFPENTPSGVPAVLESFGSRDCMGILALPIHPLLARHLGLVWTSPLMRFNYFDRQQLTDREYYGRFIDYVLANSGQR